MAEQILCEFCDEPARYTGVKFAGDHSPAHGPFDLCREHMDFYTETDGPPLRGYREIEENQ